MNAHRDPDYLNELAEKQNMAPDELLSQDNYNNQLNQLVITNDAGEAVLCDILFDFSVEETNKSYLIYTDNTVDEEGNVVAFASSYDPKIGTSALTPIESHEELDMIDAAIAAIQEMEEGLADD